MSNNNKNKKPIALITNRDQKRAAEKILGVTGRSKDELKQMIVMINAVNGFASEGLPNERDYCTAVESVSSAGSI